VNAAEARRRLAALHREIDDRAAELTATLPGSLACRRGCADCCVDDLSVFSVEADLIRHHHADLLQTGTAAALGGCAFLDQAGGCRIYAQRPYVCRTQGLPLRWLATDDSGHEVELRDICPLNEQPPAIPLMELTPAQCWTLDVFEGKLASLQAEAQGDFQLQREPLRRLFGPEKPAV